jgi:trehalose-6-phosphate synthase
VIPNKHRVFKSRNLFQRASISLKFLANFSSLKVFHVQMTRVTELLFLYSWRCSLKFLHIDFHIMLLPKILREAMSDLVIGFFLHIPFPSYDIFRLMPWASEITEALLRSDLVGFHTYDYVQNFLAVVRRSLGIDNNLGVIVRDQLVCHVDVFPIGIDFNKFNLATEHPATQVEMEKIKKRHDGQKIIFAVSRLDYTKVSQYDF